MKSSGMLADRETPTSGMTIARVARIAVVIARFVAPKTRQACGPPGASAYCEALGGADLSTRSSVSRSQPRDDGERPPARFHTVLVWTWVALLLLVVGYAMIEGERVLAELDTLKVLAAYSTGVRRLVRPESVVPAAAAQPRQSPSATRVP